MSAKMVRISDDNYEKLKRYAKSKNRSISNAGDYIIEQVLTLKTVPRIVMDGKYTDPIKEKRL